MKAKCALRVLLALAGESGRMRPVHSLAVRAAISGVLDFRGLRDLRQTDPALEPAA
ncbi:MAG: hypothetical protein IT479_11580 [Xanthomonadales bacterium]|nr:hypothetical protein [Xanthomonadales bacterium]MCC6593902.1 hypothetical protein [Xanthomonadales bacterium]